MTMTDEEELLVHLSNFSFGRTKSVVSEYTEETSSEEDLPPALVRLITCLELPDATPEMGNGFLLRHMSEDKFLLSLSSFSGVNHVKHDYVARCGDPVNAVFVLIDGEVSIQHQENNQTKLIDTVRPLNFIGEMEVLLGVSVRAADIIVKSERAQCVCMPVDDFKTLVKDVLGTNLLDSVKHRPFYQFYQSRLHRAMDKIRSNSPSTILWTESEVTDSASDTEPCSSIWADGECSGSSREYKSNNGSFGDDPCPEKTSSKSSKGKRQKNVRKLKVEGEVPSSPKIKHTISTEVDAPSLDKKGSSKQQPYEPSPPPSYRSGDSDSGGGSSSRPKPRKLNKIVHEADEFAAPSSSEDASSPKAALTKKPSGKYRNDAPPPLQPSDDMWSSSAPVSLEGKGKSGNQQKQQQQQQLASVRRGSNSAPASRTGSPTGTNNCAPSSSTKRDDVDLYSSLSKFSFPPPAPLTTSSSPSSSSSALVSTATASQPTAPPRPLAATQRTQTAKRTAPAGKAISKVGGTLAPLQSGMPVLGQDLPSPPISKIREDSFKTRPAQLGSFTRQPLLGGESSPAHRTTTVPPPPSDIKPTSSFKRALH